MGPIAAPKDSTEGQKVKVVLRYSLTSKETHVDNKQRDKSYHSWELNLCPKTCKACENLTSRIHGCYYQFSILYTLTDTNTRT